MIEADNIRDWRGKDVVDQEGNKVGSLESVYVDTGTDTPAFAGVLTGFLTSKRITFVPLQRARVSPSYVKVAWPKQTVKDAPSIETDGELLADTEAEVFSHYKLPFTVGGPRRLARR
ncbi:PRC-barrel domain-containing protein [Streptomyces sp. NPDC060194]|uniref:PRC-barrel domain-containing protein n=1 Tax=Streptomyces sp. NPDC060194 TaxID=3347069 RepID=UPI00365CAB8D